MRKSLAVLLSFTLSLSTAGLPVTAAVKPAAQPKLEGLVEKPYLELLELSTKIKVDEREVESFKKKLEEQRDSERKRLKQEEKKLEDQLKEARKELDELNRRSSRDTIEMADKRRDIHCRIQELEKKLSETRVMRETTVQVAYENKVAKLDLLMLWPKELAKIREDIDSGRARQRQYGNVEDIGFREVGKDQEKDVKLGQDALKDMRQMGLLPPRLEDEEINKYVADLTRKIASNSDIKVPVQVEVLRTEEINGFALPGGFLFINSGLISKAENESELAGVIAHELAHVAARHGARLMRRATIASLLFQSAQIAALIFTGGVVGIGTYYALQYGFFGLGLVLNLQLLGVSREFELEADQLGAQYLWKAGYDPKGFITFFDKMASEKGYVRSTSFFRTHPAFGERIVHTFKEINYLPRLEDYRVDSNEFQRIKQRLEKLNKEMEEKDERRPSLIRGRDVDCEKKPGAKSR